MRIGILQAGRTPDEMHGKHGDYDDLFKRMLIDRGFTFDTYPALDGILPDKVHDAEGWLITGSKFSAYEKHDWMRALENFLREVFAAEVPIVGVCFGHQILAKALGGKVEKHAGGWSVGPTDYFGADDKSERIIAWHQDQVTELPQGAEVIGASHFCANAMVSYGNRALTVQPHPEFTAEFLADLIKARRTVIPGKIAADAEHRIAEPLTSSDYVDRFEEFFKRHRPARDNIPAINP